MRFAWCEMKTRRGFLLAAYVGKADPITVISEVAQAKSLQLQEDDPSFFRRQREHRCIHILLCYTQ
jgi:hypothetical protein